MLWPVSEPFWLSNIHQQRCHNTDISGSKILCKSTWLIIASIFEGKHYTTILTWFETDVTNWIKHISNKSINYNSNSEAEVAWATFLHTVYSNGQYPWRFVLSWFQQTQSVAQIILPSERSKPKPFFAEHNSYVTRSQEFHSVVSYHRKRKFFK